MKHILSLSALIVIMHANCQEVIQLALDSVGKPFYQKQLKADRGVIVYTDGSHSFTRILPKEVYNLGNSTDTLSLHIESGSAGYQVTCDNCTAVQFEHSKQQDREFFRFSHGSDFVEFRVSFEKHPHGMHSAPPIDGLKQDTAIGFIRLENCFVHYAQIPGFQNTYLALIDKNFNGQIDSTDFVSLSSDSYFDTNQNRQADELKNVRTVNINGSSFELKLPDAANYSVSLRSISRALPADLTLSDTLPNVALGDRHLYDYLVDDHYLLLSYWSEYCSPCIKNLPQLAELSGHVTVLGLYAGSQSLNSLGDKYNARFRNIVCTEELKQFFSLNGLPNYLLIGKDKTVLLNTRDLDEVRAFLRER